MTMPPSPPELTDEFLREGAEYLICHAYKIFRGEEVAEGVWEDWEVHIYTPDVCRALWLWMTRNLPQLAKQYSDDDWAGFIWLTCRSAQAAALRYALEPYDEVGAEIATFMRRFYELVLLPRCTRDAPATLLNDKTASKLDSACYMIGDDYNYLDMFPVSMQSSLEEAIEYALSSPSFMLQHSALHALGHFRFSKNDDVLKWRTQLLTDWLDKFDGGFSVADLPVEQQQRLRRSAFLVESQGKKRQAELNDGRPVPMQLVMYARAALAGQVL